MAAYRRFMTHVTCRLTARNRDQLRNPTLLFLQRVQYFLQCLGVIAEELRKQMIAYDRAVGVHDVRLSELDLRCQCLETANYDGVLVWKIGDYAERRRQALDGRVLSLYSQPFYTSRYGYKMCARVYLNGDGAGRNTHLSLFFVVMQVI